jgi:hypothetical protein
MNNFRFTGIIFGTISFSDNRPRKFSQKYKKIVSVYFNFAFFGLGFEPQSRQRSQKEMKSKPTVIPKEY